MFVRIVGAEVPLSDFCELIRRLHEDGERQLAVRLVVCSTPAHTRSRSLAATRANCSSRHNDIGWKDSKTCGFNCSNGRTCARRV